MAAATNAELQALTDVFGSAAVGEVPLLGYSIVNQGWVRFDTPGQPTVFWNPRFGRLVIGMHPNGKFDQWLFEEIGGGGVMTIGYTVDDHGRIQVLLLNAARFNLLGDMQDIECAGGFFDSVRQARLAESLRETIEEAGIVPPDLVQLPGRLFIGNRAFFFLSGEDKGTHAFCYRLNANQLALIAEDPGLTLISWGRAVRQCRDGLSGMVLARLRAFVDRELGLDDEVDDLATVD